MNYIAGYGDEAKVAVAEAVGEFGVVDADEVKDGGVQVVDADAIDGFEADLVVLAVVILSQGLKLPGDMVLSLLPHYQVPRV